VSNGFQRHGLLTRFDFDLRAGSTDDFTGVYPRVAEKETKSQNDNASAIPCPSAAAMTSDDQCLSFRLASPILNPPPLTLQAKQLPVEIVCFRHLRHSGYLLTGLKQGLIVLGIDLLCRTIPAQELRDNQNGTRLDVKPPASTGNHIAV
jgi:hypothetical protein